jgi:hypothetical protein
METGQYKTTGLNRTVFKQPECHSHQVVSTPACIQEIPGLNLNPDTCHPD